MQNWRTEEVEFIVQGLDKDTKDLYLDFCSEFGGRSYDSIQKKIKKLREAHALFPDEEENTDLVSRMDSILQDPVATTDLKIDTVSAVLKKERKELAKAWLEGIVDVSEEMKDRLLYYGSRNVVLDRKS